MVGASLSLNCLSRAKHSSDLTESIGGDLDFSDVTESDGADRSELTDRAGALGALGSGFCSKTSFRAC
eukprot:2186889-Rhodomonas_salina.1